MSNTVANTSHVYEYVFKILVVGELATGKTSIIKKYVHNLFSKAYKVTIGLDFALKTLQYDANTFVKMQLWDIAGQERFTHMTRVYYKEAVGAFVVYDVTRPQSLETAIKWKQDIDQKVLLSNNNPIPCVLLANKSDLVGIQIPKGPEPAEMDEFCKTHGFVGWFETSAKTAKGIDTAARALVDKVMASGVVQTVQQQEAGLKASGLVRLGEAKPEGSGESVAQENSGYCCSGSSRK